MFILSSRPEILRLTEKKQGGQRVLAGGSCESGSEPTYLYVETGDRLVVERLKQWRSWFSIMSWVQNYQYHQCVNGCERKSFGEERYRM